MNKIDKNKTYVTKQSKLPVRILATGLKRTMSVVAVVTFQDGSEGVCCYDPFGSVASGSVSGLDLVEAHPLASFDRSALPMWARKAIAMDESGAWFSYAEVPMKKISYWAPAAWMCEIPPEYAPKNFHGAWEDSLCVWEDDA